MKSLLLDLLDLLKEKGLYLNVFRLIFWEKDNTGDNGLFLKVLTVSSKRSCG
jgi:hypothetical protein